jgi:hypothetical protein
VVAVPFDEIHGNPNFSMAMSGTDLLDVPRPISKAYFSGLCFREFPLALYGTIPP